MFDGFINSLYIIASIFFILSLGGLSHQESAVRGNVFGMLGMILAVGGTIAAKSLDHIGIVIGMMAIGGVIGILVTMRVRMTAMPQLVAILHSLVGLAAVFVGFANFIEPLVAYEGTEKLVHEVEIYVGVFIGAITFTGSVAAFGKLQGLISSRPLMLPLRHWINLAIIIACLWLGAEFLGAESQQSGTKFSAHHDRAGLFIGAAPCSRDRWRGYAGRHFNAEQLFGLGCRRDRLHAFKRLADPGWRSGRKQRCDFELHHVSGDEPALRQRYSGRVRHIGKAAPAASEAGGEISEIMPEEASTLLTSSQSAVIVPGYGMAVAHAQHPVAELTRKLREKGIQVRFAIHPVAGRMPGHMNVLLAEARVPYDIVLEMDEINPDMPDTDVILIIGCERYRQSFRTGKRRRSDCRDARH